MSIFRKEINAFQQNVSKRAPKTSQNKIRRRLHQWNSFMSHCVIFELGKARPGSTGHHIFKSINRSAITRAGMYKVLKSIPFHSMLTANSVP